MRDPALDNIHSRLNTDLEFFAAHAPMMFKPKTGGELQPFVLNRAQKHIHACLEEQLKRTGRVRACILKGRQQGCSTYVAARFYWKATRKPGVSVLILSHEGKSTEALFQLVKRYQDHVHPAIRPEEGASNTRQLRFAKLGSDFSVGTAGNAQIGRGSTVQLMHASEIAYWDNAFEIQDGAFESIGDVPGTEIILESTANGAFGLFYQKCMDALAGRGDHQLIFVPWHWDLSYERASTDETLTEEEELYASHFLAEYPKAQMVRKILWRRAKIVDLATGQNPESGLAKFRTIYPSSPSEAFQSSGVGLFRPDAIIAARKSIITDEVSPRVAGVDPAGDSDNSDRTVIAIRQGRHVERVIKYNRMRPMELAGILAKLIESDRLDMVYIDRGYGEGTIDRLHELGFRRQVQGIAFNERPLNPDLYTNKRSEIIIEFANWLNAGGVRIPDDEEAHADMAAIPVDVTTSNGLRAIKPKSEIKKLLGKSCDVVDSIALTFSYPVNREAGGGIRKASDIRRKSGVPTQVTRGIRK